MDSVALAQANALGGTVGQMRKQIVSALVTNNLIDVLDPIEITMLKGFVALTDSNLMQSDVDLMFEAVSAKRMSGTINDDDLYSGLLYSALTRPTTAPAHLRCLICITKDSYNYTADVLCCVARLWPRLRDIPRQQELVRIGADAMSRVVSLLLRWCTEMPAVLSDVLFTMLSDRMYVLYTMLSLHNSEWVLKDEQLACQAAYTALVYCAESESSSTAFQSASSLIKLLIEKYYNVIKPLGRDMMRLLLDLSHHSSFQALYLCIPDPMSAWSTNTPVKYLALALDPVMETELLFMMTNVRRGGTTHKYYQSWYLTAHKEHMHTVQAIRYIVNTNAKVQANPDIPSVVLLPRWFLVGWLLHITQDQLQLRKCMTALVIDWLCFNQRDDSAHVLEPALLIMSNTINKYPALSESVMQCLINPKIDMDQAWIKTNVSKAFSIVTNVGLMSSLDIFLSAPSLSEHTKKMLAERFPSQTRKRPPPLAALGGANPALRVLPIITEKVKRVAADDDVPESVVPAVTSALITTPMDELAFTPGIPVVVETPKAWPTSEDVLTLPPHGVTLCTASQLKLLAGRTPSYSLNTDKLGPVGDYFNAMMSAWAFVLESPRNKDSMTTVCNNVYSKVTQDTIRSINWPMIRTKSHTLSLHDAVVDLLECLSTEHVTVLIPVMSMLICASLQEMPELDVVIDVITSLRLSFDVHILVLVISSAVCRGGLPTPSLCSVIKELFNDKQICDILVEHDIWNYTNASSIFSGLMVLNKHGLQLDDYMCHQTTVDRLKSMNRDDLNNVYHVILSGFGTLWLSPTEHVGVTPDFVCLMSNAMQQQYATRISMDVARLLPMIMSHDTLRNMLLTELKRPEDVAALLSLLGDTSVLLLPFINNGGVPVVAAILSTDNVPPCMMAVAAMRHDDVARVLSAWSKPIGKHSSCTQCAERCKAAHERAINLTKDW